MSCECDTGGCVHISLFQLVLIMFEPVRGGTRGGQAEFKWSDVSADKDREVSLLRLIISFRISTEHQLQNYLGHSINAPTGRWQKNKDVHWYSRDDNLDISERELEIRKIKELEAEALSVALFVSAAALLSFPFPINMYSPEVSDPRRIQQQRRHQQAQQLQNLPMSMIHNQLPPLKRRSQCKGTSSALSRKNRNDGERKHTGKKNEPEGRPAERRDKSSRTSNIGENGTIPGTEISPRPLVRTPRSVAHTPPANLLGRLDAVGVGVGVPRGRLGV